jgi:hypothetical protein
LRSLIQERKPMANETVFCAGCGITLRPFMKRCPRCGTERDGVIELIAPNVTVEEPSAPKALPAAPKPQPAPRETKTTVIPLDEAKRRDLVQEGAATPYDAIVLSPPDKTRRFPLFTRAQVVLLLVGLGLLLVGLLIAYLLWKREAKDTVGALGGLQVSALPPPAVVPSDASSMPAVNASPTPAVMVDDQVLQEEARKTLVAYNPTGFARYKFTVKDGVITLTGEAAHQPEKDGATNVLRLLAGAKTVINNLVVKPENQTSPSPTLAPTPASTQASLTLPAQPEAAKPSPATETPNNDQAALEAKREAERLRRELEAARQREAELQRQRELEAQRQREAEEALKRQQQEEARRLEAERQARSVPSRPETSSLRSGTVAWSGLVDGVAEIVISGSSAAVRHVSGETVREARASFSAAVPRSSVSMKLLSVNGRGTIRIAQEPDAANGYTTIVRIDDSANGGAKLHQFTLRWSAQ